MDLEVCEELSAEELIAKKDSIEAEIKAHKDFLEAVSSSGGGPLIDCLCLDSFSDPHVGYGHLFTCRRTLRRTNL